MKEPEKFKPLTRDIFFYGDGSELDKVRSAVMGLLEYFCSYYQGTVEGSCFHQGHHLCESCNEFYKWFPIFFEDVDESGVDKK